MAAASHFSTRIYGQVQGNEPFQDSNGNTAFSNVFDYPRSIISSFPTQGTEFFPLRNGYIVGGAYVYSVIQVAPTGLNVHGQQYVTDTDAATLATLAG